MPDRRLRLARGALFGTAAAVASVLVWILACYLTESQLTYLAVGVAIAVALAAGNGARRGGSTTAALAVGLTAIALAVGLYYTQRIAFIREEALAHRLLHVPLLPRWDWFTTVLRGAFKRSITMYLTVLVALVAAGGYGYRGPMVRGRYVGPRHLPRRPR
jgi:hypothetical protein